MSAERTPGPWKAHVGISYEQDGTACIPVHSFSDDNCVRVATVYAEHDREDVLRANANCIAMSLEMLEFMEHLTNIMFLQAMPQALQDRLFAILKQAKGEL